MKTHINGRKFTVTFAEDMLLDVSGPPCAVMVCILRNGPDIYSGLAILNDGDKWNKRTGQALAFKRAFEAAYCPMTLWGCDKEDLKESSSAAWQKIRFQEWEAKTEKVEVEK